MTSNNEEKCGTCRFSANPTTVTLDGTRHEREGVIRACRLNPPIPVTEYVFNDPHVEFQFPTVHEDDWCGQYIPT